MSCTCGRDSCSCGSFLNTWLVLRTSATPPPATPPSCRTSSLPLRFVTRYEKNDEMLQLSQFGCAEGKHEHPLKVIDFYLILKDDFFISSLFCIAIAILGFYIMFKCKSSLSVIKFTKFVGLCTLKVWLPNPEKLWERINLCKTGLSWPHSTNELTQGTCSET